MRSASNPKIAVWLPEIHSLRCVAMTMVFLVHVNQLMLPYLKAHPSLTQAAIGFWGLGKLGTDTFLFLSGFLVTGLCLRKYAGYSHYLRRRLLRLLPPYWIVLGALVVAALILPPVAADFPRDPETRVARTLENMFLLEPVLGRTPLLGPAWALTYILGFTLLLPLVVHRFGGGTRHLSGRLVGYGALGGLIILGHAVHPETVPLRLHLLVLGALAREAMERGFRLPPRIPWVGFPILLGIRLLAQASHAPGALKETVMILATAGLLICLTDGVLFQCSNWGRRLLLSPQLAGIADCSYAFYLLHSPVTRALSMVIFAPLAPLFRNPAGFVLFQILSFFAALGPAWLFYRHIELRLYRRETTPALSPAQPVPETEPLEAVGATD